MYTNTYDSPLGKIFLAGDGRSLTGLAFETDKYFSEKISGERKDCRNFDETKEWLDIYFSGKDPVFMPSIKLTSMSPLQIAVWRELQLIFYGKTSTYGEIAKKVNSSARAVGAAVGHNPISLIVPCHRVLGAGGKVTGYSAGVDKKIKLLELEGVTNFERG